MKKILGIDIGITSVGWGVIDTENNIIDAGVRLFDEVEHKYKNSDRREKRGARRILRRRKQRILDMRTLLINEGLINNDFTATKDPYLLRQKGLKEKLDQEELATILLFYAKRRGTSLEVVDEEVKSGSGGTKEILSINEKSLASDKFVVITQLNKLKEEGKIRDTSNVFKTEDFVKEISEIFKNQDLKENLKLKVLEIITRRRHFSEGPGNKFSPSPYGRYREITGEVRNEILMYINEHHQNDYKNKRFVINFNNRDYTILKNGMIINAEKLNLIELMRGKCSLYPDELRAPKQSVSAEIFNLLNDLNNLTISNRENVKITEIEKKYIINEFRLKGNMTVNNVLKYLNAELHQVSGFRLNNKQEPILTEFVGYKKLRKVFNDLKLEIFPDKDLDKIMEVLTNTQVEEERIEEISKFVNNIELVKALSLITRVREYHNLSLKAIYQLNEEMMIESKNQQQIITLNDLRNTIKLDRLSFDETLILSPIAKRAHREALRVIEQLIKQYGNFKTIVIETTRDKNSAEQRRNIQNGQLRNKLNKEKAEEIIGEYSPENVNRSNIEKILLYNEQNGKCAYTGTPIDLSLLIRDSKAYEVDHIIPLSISYDDSRNNKVLVTPTVNNNKGNRTPFGYFNSGKVNPNYEIKSWDKFESIVTMNNNYSVVKKRNLLTTKDITKYDTLKEFANRNIVDTSYAARSLMTTLKNYFEYNNIDTVVRTIRGKQTNLFRRIGIQEIFKNKPEYRDDNPLIKDRDNYIHHAQDALIIAGLSNKNSINQLYRFTIHLEDELYDKYTGEINPDIKDESIVKYLYNIAELDDDFIKYSWKIDTKPNRRLADDTIYSTRIINKEHRVVKTYKNIYDLTNKQLEKIFSEKERENLLVFRHDKQTFNKLLEIYQQYVHESKPFLAFKNEHGYITKYAKKNNGPMIKDLKYLEDRLGNHLDITPEDSIDKKVVKLQISPYRTDIFYSKKEKLYKFITIRYTDIEFKNNRHIISKEWYESAKEIKNINNNYEFKFSLYRNSIIKMSIVFKGEEDTNLYKFIATNNDNSNKIEVKPINKYESKRLMVTIGKNTMRLEKYNVSITGKVSKVHKEELKYII